MNLMKIIIADNFQDANKSVISQIDAKNIAYKNLVIVPDRFSLLTEKTIFEVLNISAYFNIEVMGVSDLANFIFKELGLEFEYVNKQESKIILRKALKNLKGQLSYFTGTLTNGLVDMVYNALSLLKTNQITGDNLKNIQNSGSAIEKKFDDLGLILNEFDRLLNGKLDSSKILEKLQENIVNCDMSKYNLYYVNFDSFTKQGFEVLKKISQTANSLTIGIVNSDNSKNSFIYEKDIYEKLTTFAKNKEVNLQIETASNTLNNLQNTIKENLFAFKPQIVKGNNINIIQTENKEIEVEYVARQIKELVVNKNARYQDVVIAVSDLENYKNQIDKTFTDFNFSYYIDTEVSLSETQTIKFLTLLLKSVLMESDVNDFKNIINSSFSEINNEDKIVLFDFIEKYDIRNNLLLTNSNNENIEKILKNIKNKLKINKNNEKNINYYINLLKNLIGGFRLIEKNELLVQEFKTKKYYKQEKIYEQIFDLLNKIFNSLIKILENEELSCEEFMEIFCIYLDEQKMSTVPLSTDNIFVGDATSSFFEVSKYLFVLGCNERNLPRYLSDTAIISDDVIDKVVKEITFTPTVKMINRRNKFKVFSLLLGATEKIFLSYPITDDSGTKLLASGFVKELEKIFETKHKVVNGFITEDFYDNDLNDFVVSTGTKHKAKLEFIKLLKFSNLPKSDEIGVLGKYFDYDLLKNKTLKNEKIDDLQNLFFKNNKTKISQIESFYSCPFKHFVQYGLQLKEKDIASVMPNNVGDFLHFVACEFLKPENDYLEKINKNIEKIEEIIKKIIKKAENNSKFAKFLLMRNKISFNIVKEESKSLCNYLYQNSLISNFKTKYVELSFGKNNGNNFEYKVDNQTFEVGGVIDRVDVLNNQFVIIDYKTGGVHNPSFTELYYGEKIQMYVYAKVFSEFYKSKPAGVFYFPISNDFNDGDNEPYKLMGTYIYNQEFLDNFDISLKYLEMESSSMFSCSLVKQKVQNKKEYSTRYSVDEKIFNLMCDYSIKMMESATREILDGEISPSPRNGACTYCKYKALCQKNSQIVERQKVYDIKSETILSLIKEENEDE